MTKWGRDCKESSLLWASSELMAALLNRTFSVPYTACWDYSLYDDVMAELGTFLAPSDGKESVCNVGD